jgi:hypothetical protein
MDIGLDDPSCQTITVPIISFDFDGQCKQSPSLEALEKFSKVR